MKRAMGSSGVREHRIARGSRPCPILPPILFHPNCCYRRGPNPMLSMLPAGRAATSTHAGIARKESHLVHSCTDADADDVDLATVQQASNKRAKKAAAASKKAAALLAASKRAGRQRKRSGGAALGSWLITAYTKAAAVAAGAASRAAARPPAAAIAASGPREVGSGEV